MKKRTRSVTACTKCRRMKLRCDVVDKFPNKCSRCEKAKVFCEMDNHILHHMTNKNNNNSSSKIKKTNQLNSTTTLSPSETKSLITALSSTAPVPKNHENNTNNNNDTMPSLLPINGNIFHGQPHYYNNNTQQVFQHQILNNNSIISSSRIEQLFDLFLRYQYQYIPVFPKKYLTSKTLLYECTEYTGSEILFWTICAVSSRMSLDNHKNNNDKKKEKEKEKEKEDDNTKEYQSISDHVKYLIQKTGMVSHYILRPFKTLAHIYALVLLCMWPLPHRSTQEDMSYMYSGQAIHMGLLLGIHRSWFRKTEFLVFDKQYKKTNEQSRAKFHALMWMASFFVNQQLADLHGVPATANLDYSLLSEFHIEKKSTIHSSSSSSSSSHKDHKKINDNKKRKRRKKDNLFIKGKEREAEDDDAEGNDNDNEKEEEEDDNEEEEEEEEEVLDDFLKQIHILHLLNRSIYTLGVDTTSTLHSHNGIEPSCRKLIHTNLGTDLSQLGMDFSPMNPITELVYLHAKLQLHSFLLQPDSLDRDKINSIAPISYVCSQIIHLIQSMYQQQQKEKEKEKEKENRHYYYCYQSWPVFIIRDLINATVILFRLVTSSYKPWLDEESAFNAIQTSHTLLKNISLTKDDPAARGARIIDKLRLMASLGALKTEINYLQTRLGAGLFWGLLMDYKLWAIKLEEEESQKQQQQQHHQETFIPSSSSSSAMIIPPPPLPPPIPSTFQSTFINNSNNNYYNIGDDLFSLFNFDDPLLFNIDDFLLGK